MGHRISQIIGSWSSVFPLFHKLKLEEKMQPTNNGKIMKLFSQVKQKDPRIIIPFSNH